MDTNLIRCQQELSWSRSGRTREVGMTFGKHFFQPSLFSWYEFSVGYGGRGREQTSQPYISINWKDIATKLSEQLPMGLPRWLLVSGINLSSKYLGRNHQSLPNYGHWGQKVLGTVSNQNRGQKFVTQVKTEILW